MLNENNYDEKGLRYYDFMRESLHQKISLIIFLSHISALYLKEDNSDFLQPLN